MDRNIIAISVAGTSPIPILGVVARFYRMGTKELFELAELSKSVDVTLRYPGIDKGSSTEEPRCLRITLEDIGAGKKVIALQDINFGYKKGGMFFTDLAYNFNL